MPLQPGQTFNESVETIDPASGKRRRQLTVRGAYNETPTYHLNAAFTRDSRHLVFATARDGGSALVKCDVATGDCTVLAVTDGAGGGGGGELLATGKWGGGFTGGGSALAQASGWVISRIGRSLHAVHLDSLQHKMLIEDIGREYRFGGPMPSVDGTKAIVTRAVEHPDIVAGDPHPKRHYFQACVDKFQGQPTDYLEVDIATGRVETVFHEEVAGNNHVQPCPADADLWLIDRDWPPGFNHRGDDRRTTRAWLLDRRTNALRPLEPRNNWKFQMHTNWNHRGDRIYYHGRAEDNLGMYVGAWDRETGDVVWQHTFPRIIYGHVSTDTRGEAIVTDGLIDPTLITALHYEEADASGAPRIEILARHETEWGSPAGQYSHPHPHVSPDGKWLAFNHSRNGRSDVSVVRL